MQERLISSTWLLMHRHSKFVLRIERNAPRLFDTIGDECDSWVSLLVKFHAGHVALVLDCFGTIAILDVQRSIPFLEFVATCVVRSIVPERFVVAPAHKSIGRRIGVREPLIHWEAGTSILHFLAEAERQSLSFDLVPFLTLNI